MRSRIDMVEQIGVGRAVALAGTSLALYAAMSLAILVVNQPVETVQALFEFVTPGAQASSRQPDATSTTQILPTSAQLGEWDKVEYAPGDFDPLPGQIED